MAGEADNDVTDNEEQQSEENETLLTGDNADEGESTDKDSDENQGDAEESAEDDAPEAYADFDLPEGMELNEAVNAEATELFKESGLSQEQAQKFVTLFADKIQASVDAQAESFSQLMDDWQTSSKNDKEFGGDKFDENIGIAMAALDKFGTPELKEFLQAHGAGNHPEMIRFMVKVGRLTKEDTLDSGNASQDKKDHASLLYPNS